MKITKWNAKKLDNSCFKILQSSFAPLCQCTMKQSLWSHRIFNLLVGSAQCGARPGKMFVGCASKKPDVATGAAKLSKKFSRQWNKWLHVEETMSSWLCQVRIPKNLMWCLFFCLYSHMMLDKLPDHCFCSAYIVLCLRGVWFKTQVWKKHWWFALAAELLKSCHLNINTLWSYVCWQSPVFLKSTSNCCILR